MRRQPIYESVPNFSEGTRTGVIAELAGAAAKARVLDVNADPDHNRVGLSRAGAADVLPVVRLGGNSRAAAQGRARELCEGSGAGLRGRVYFSGQGEAHT